MIFLIFGKKRKDFILFLELFIEKLKLQSYAKIDVFYLWPRLFFSKFCKKSECSW